MIVKARKSKNNEWGLLEKYEAYRHFDKGYIKATTAVTVEKALAPCYAYRGEEFIPISQIDDEVGLDKYIKAKKPFYFKAKEGILEIDPDAFITITDSYQVYGGNTHKKKKEVK